jgi:hypothetical protein
MNSQTQEALKMAIEALEEAEDIIEGKTTQGGYFYKAIQACKEALEQPAQEPVALKFPTMLRKMWSGGEVQEWLDKQQSLYSHPAPSWQGLSDDEIDAVWFEVVKENNFEGAGKYFARAIEQALKEKNT